MDRHENIEEIVYPTKCPKCLSDNVLCSDWMDSEYIWIRITCQDCHYFWREKVILYI